MFGDKNNIKLFGLEFFNTINIQARQAQLGLGINKTIMFHQPRFITVWTLQILAGFSPLNVLVQVEITGGGFRIFHINIYVNTNVFLEVIIN